MLVIRNKKTKANSSLSSAALVPSPGTGGDDAAAAAAEDPSKRPDGKKAEKKKLRQRLTIEALDYLVEKMKQTDDVKEIKKEQRCDRLIDLQEEKIKLEREKFEFQRDMEDERILSLDLSNMTYRLQQYYERRQDEILTRRALLQDGIVGDPFRCKVASCACECREDMALLPGHQLGKAKVRHLRKEDIIE
ncbi:hypothetical protein HU200_016775 [Digitaria exilis]|uniref:No apical meristem-associated C-terminal domain-containing protein n=1 Tax=Digitaria exilis TaxID=1010633 RepID=A0A835F8B9_9POAL|nr:hypothetical protein HU200_016775 [Digitaria exilis]